MTSMIPAHFQSLYDAYSPREFQKQAWKKFIEKGIHPRTERWKYFDLNLLFNQTFQILPKQPLEIPDHYLQKLNQFDSSDALIVFINGRFSVSSSRLYELQTEISDKSPKFSFELEWYGLLNQCFSPDCFKIYIKNNVSSRVVRFIHIYDASAAAWIHSQVELEIQAHAKVVLIEEHWSEQSSQEWVNHSKKIILNEHACLYHASLDQQSLNAKRFLQTDIQQHTHSFYQHFNNLKNSQLSRDDIYVELQGTHATCDLFGLIDARVDRQCIDVHLDIVHAASHTKSDMFYKGVLDQQTKSIFSGALHVQKKCDHVVAYQGNHHLLLSKQAEAYSKPELQIYSDQIMCKHGATVGQLDEDVLFYLRSRGINEQQAMEMILSSFKEEVRSKLSLQFLEQIEKL